MTERMWLPTARDICVLDLRKSTESTPELASVLSRKGGGGVGCYHFTLTVFGEEAEVLASALACDEPRVHSNACHSM
jgi:hypothetical protein